MFIRIAFFFSEYIGSDTGNNYGYEIGRVHTNPYQVPRRRAVLHRSRIFVEDTTRGVPCSLLSPKPGPWRIGMDLHWSSYPVGTNLI